MKLFDYSEEFYIKIQQLYTVHFWYKARDNFFLYFIKKYADAEKSIADLGCGPCTLLNGLFENNYKKIYGIDAFHLRLKIARKKYPDLKLITSDILSLTLKSGFIDNILIFDSLEHIEKDTDALKEINRVLKNGGLIFISVPAYRFLWSKTDSSSGHFRRYNKKQLELKLKQSGFNTVYSSYFNTLLFPVFLCRLIIIKITYLFNKNKEEKSLLKSIVMPNRLINKLFYVIMTLELLLIKNIHMPFGSALFFIAEKNNK